jgi:hypothetical protein
MLNRTALILRAKKPFTDWVRSTDEDGPLPDPKDKQTVYLIPDVDGERDLEAFLAEHFDEFFQRELGGWYTDEERWPKKRTYKMFRDWLNVEFHTVVEDTCADPLEDDDDG